MQQQTPALGILMIVVLGLGALVLCLIAVAIAAGNKKKGFGATLLGLLLGLGVLGGGLLSFAYLFTARTSLPIPNGNGGQGQYREMMSQTVVPEPTFAILAVLGVVGLVLVLGVAGLVAAVRKGGGWVILGLGVLCVPVLLLLFVTTKYSVMRGAGARLTADEVWNHGHAEMAHEVPPLIEMGPTPPSPPSPPTSGRAVAEVTDWSHDDDVHVEVDAHGSHVSVGHGTLEVHAGHGEDGDDSHGHDGHDSHGADAHDPHGAGGHADTIAETGELPSPENTDHNGISHAPIILSKLPDSHPEWVDQTDGKWDDGKKVWTQTVQVGPYETEDECQENLFAEVSRASKDFAEWHAAGISHADAEIRNYNSNYLPRPRIDTGKNGGSSSTGTSSSNGHQGWETWGYRRGHVRETYHTTVETSVSDDPMPVVFARVEFDQDYRQQVDRSVRHGLSFKRAIKAGSIWGIGLLGLVATLGGLRLAGAGERISVASTTVSEEVHALAAKDVSTQRPKTSWITQKNIGLLLAPIICTLIFFMTSGPPQHLFPISDPTFWPKWVWFGCGIAFVMKTVIPRLKAS